MEPLTIAIVILTIIYLFLAVRNNPWCFVIAIGQCVLWGYHVFFNLGLFFDTILQIFYIVMAIWGIIAWRSSKPERTRPITWLGVSYNITSFVIGVTLSLTIAYLYEQSYSTNMAYLDSITTGFAIMATFLLVYRKIDNWIYFVFIDMTYIYIYIRAGDAWMAAIMLLYTVMAIYGFRSWKKLMPNKSIEISH